MTGAYQFLCGLTLEDGRRWGETAAPFQHGDAQALLDPSAAVRSHYWTRPRGGSKTTDAAGCGLAALVEQLPAGAQGHCFAVDKDQSSLFLTAAAGLVHRSGLAGLIDVQGSKITHRNHGAAISVVSSDSASAYGLLSHWLVVDELAWWPSGHSSLWEAIVSTLPKVRTARLLVVTTAGDPTSLAARALDHARASTSWRSSETPGPLPWMSTAVLEEQRRMLPASAYARLHENRWVAGEDKLLSREDVEACAVLPATLPPQPGVSYVVCVDLGWRNDRTVIGVGHAERDGVEIQRVVVDHIESMQGSKAREVDLTAVEDRVRDLTVAYGQAPVHFDPAQAIALAQRLRQSGITAKEHTFTVASNSNLALTLLQLVRERRLAIPADDALIDELASVRLREVTPGSYRVDHASGQHDDQVIVVGMLSVHLALGGSQGAAFLEAWTRMTQPGYVPPPVGGALFAGHTHFWGPDAICTGCGVNRP
jgi:hypothetical protein